MVKMAQNFAFKKPVFVSNFVTRQLLGPNQLVQRLTADIEKQAYFLRGQRLFLKHT